MGHSAFAMPSLCLRSTFVLPSLPTIMEKRHYNYGIRTEKNMTNMILWNNYNTLLFLTLREKRFQDVLYRQF